MPIGKLFGINPALAATTNPLQAERNPQSFVKDTFNFGDANPNRPESRDELHGRNLYCLA